MLSEAEITSLLSFDNTAKPAVAAKSTASEARVYDFRSPERFTRDQMRAIEMVHEALAESIRNNMPGYLSTDVRCTVIGQAQTNFEEHLGIVPDQTQFFMLALDPLPDRIVGIFDQETCLSITERLLGGTPADEIAIVPLTPLGEVVMRGVWDFLMPHIKTAWKPIIDVDPRFIESSSKQIWVNMLLANRWSVATSFEIVIGGRAGTLVIYVPYSMLKGIADDVSPSAWLGEVKQESSQPAEMRVALEDFMQRASLEVRLIVGTMNLTFGELRSLRPGDVLELDSPVGRPYELWVGGGPSQGIGYTAEPGTHKKKYAAKILDRVIVEQ
ncbi:MAG: FliM/FliN family flagellar motor switch protein [Chloroflexi bacterium]|nr:FliM/FliN family flagellar motor switch protein [Chloroflexota bacterium]